MANKPLQQIESEQLVEAKWNNKLTYWQTLITLAGLFAALGGGIAGYLQWKHNADLDKLKVFREQLNIIYSVENATNRWNVTPAARLKEAQVQIAFEQACALEPLISHLLSLKDYALLCGLSTYYHDTTRIPKYLSRFNQLLGDSDNPSDLYFAIRVAFDLGDICDKVNSERLFVLVESRIRILKDGDFSRLRVKALLYERWAVSKVMHYGDEDAGIALLNKIPSAFPGSEQAMFESYAKSNLEGSIVMYSEKIKDKDTSETVTTEQGVEIVRTQSKGRITWAVRPTRNPSDRK